MDAVLTALLHGIHAIGDWRFAIAFLGMFCETSLFVGLLIPGDTIVLLISTANHGALEWGLVFASVVLGSLAGESVGYAIGSAFGPRLRVSRLGRRIGERQWLRAERWIEHRGGVAILVSRFLPVLHALVPVTTGMGEFPYRRFLAWTTPACVVWAAVYVSVGQAAGRSYEALSGTLHFASWIFFAVIVAALVGVALGKRVLHRFEHRTNRIR